MTPEEARDLARRALKFKAERSRLPSLTSPDPWERRMAEGVAYLARMKAEPPMADFTDDDDALLAELGVEVEAKRTSTRTAEEERVIAGFEEIQRFFETNKRLPRHGEAVDIFERLYAVRLDRIREIEACRSIVEPMDYQGLLGVLPVMSQAVIDEMDDDALLAELGIEAEVSEITTLKHVRSVSEKRAARRSQTASAARTLTSLSRCLTRYRPS